LERERTSLANQVSSLEIRVANAPSQDAVDKMRHELRILKKLEYNAVDLDGHDRDDPEMTPGSGKEGDLESVLVAKLRKVEHDLVRERREKSEGNKDREELKKQLVVVQKSLADAEQLIASLENDLQLAVATPESSTTQTDRSNIEIPYGSINPPNPNTLSQILDPKAPPVSNPPPVKTNNTASEKANDDHSVATIVMAQRDRLRARCDALEAERDSFKRELQVQVQTAESLKSDNTKLYEKVRYLQTFNGASSGSGSAYTRGRNSLASDRDLDLEALESRYEASVDPFRQFSRAERQRKLNEMSPMERIVFIVAKTFLGSKQMRTVLCCYVLTLHLLVFATTYHWSHSSSCDYLHDHMDLAHFHGGVPLPETPNGVAVANAAANALTEEGNNGRS
jgi:homeobox protein cut-like